MKPEQISKKILPPEIHRVDRVCQKIQKLMLRELVTVTEGHLALAAVLGSTLEQEGFPGDAELVNQLKDFSADCARALMARRQQVQ